MSRPSGMEQKWYDKYKADGFSDKEIEKIWQDTLYFRSEMSQKKEGREITSSTYETAQRRLQRNVSNWLGLPKEG